MKLVAMMKTVQLQKKKQNREGWRSKGDVEYGCLC